MIKNIKIERNKMDTLLGYEVLVSDSIGDKTVELCATVEEARTQRDFFQSIYKFDKVYITKWMQDINGNEITQVVK